MEVTSIALDDVQIVGTRRTLRGVSDLAASINEVGLLQPIMVTPANVLVFGHHRMEACRELGWETIPAVVREMDDLNRQLVEEHENLMRNDLTVLDRADAAKRAKDIYEALHPQTKRGISGAATRWESVAPESPDASEQSSLASFTEAAARKAGRSTRLVQQDVQIAEKLTEHTKEMVRDTDIADHKTDLLKLARIEEPALQEEVARIVTEGYAPTVDAAIELKVRERHQVPPAVRAVLDRPDPELDRMKFYATFQKRVYVTQSETGWIILDVDYCHDTLPDESAYNDIDGVFMQIERWIAQFRQCHSRGLRVVGGSRS